MSSTVYAAVILYAIIFTGADADCNKTYDMKDCVYYVYCEESLTYSAHQFYEEDYSGNICKYNIETENPNLRPIILSYNEIFPKEEVPGQRQDFLRLIITLNISNHEYVNFPIISHMENLETLDISRNYLKTAKLSNSYELPSLTRIDLSHNTINNIEVVRSEHPFERLVDINLSHNYLVTIPDAIFDVFGELESLDISYNFITTLTPLTFEGVKKLLHLDMSSNRISDVDSSLFRFNKLTRLSFNNNKLKEIKKSDFEKLVNLKRLDLSSNLISSVDLNVFDNMGSLESLDLSQNQMKTISKQTFAGLNNLVEINLSANYLSELPRRMFKGKSLAMFLIQENTLAGSLARGTFEGLTLVTNLDLSNQKLTSIEDLAFFGLDNVQKILLNDNKIYSLSKNCFKMIQRLTELDLSNNHITSIDFNKEDLIGLQSLFLRNNHITQIQYRYFQNLNSLQYLDLSYNNISHLDKDSFKSLKELTSFEISNNPLSGALEENTFEGLHSLPNLDISRTMLISICNDSFMSMVQLRDLNVSYGNIKDLQYNAFRKTGAIQSIDLSFNQLEVFKVNSSDLTGLRTLFLKGNRLIAVGKDMLRGFISLNKITLSNNNILSVDDNAFKDQSYLRSLDLSYNPHLNFNILRIKNNKNLNSLYLMGIASEVCFTNASDIPITTLDISNARIKEPKALKLQELMRLDTLVLNNNDIVKLEVESFANVKTLRNLDVSFNKISFIQPGTFKDNGLLHALNISHNALHALSYGIFRGLIYLHTLDMSYNEIDSLESERFYEVKSLNVLIADHNKITTINAEDFLGTSLTTLSIGENPLPCNILVNLKDKNLPFEITAIRLQETSDNENIDGIVCNMNGVSQPTLFASSVVDETNNKILVDIRNILLNGNKINEKALNAPAEKENTSLTNVADTIKDSLINATDKLDSKITNVSSQIVKQINNTNLLLGKISKILSVNWRTVFMPSKENRTESLIPYIEGVKMDLENSIAAEKERIDEIDVKIATINSRIESVGNDAPKHEMYVSNDVQSQTEPLFTKICVAMILSILVCIVLYKFYNSRMFIRKSFSLSTRELPGAMENSAL